MTAFDKHQVSRFRFVRCEFAAESGVAKLVYAFDDGTEMVETITVPGAPFVLDEARASAVQRALQLLHLIAGVSYYKAGVPETVSIDSYAIDADTAALVEAIYLNGLGEFAYRNGLNLRGRFRLPVQGDAVQAPVLGLQPHALVAIGGGKDSLVSIEALRRAGVDETVTWIWFAADPRLCRAYRPAHAESGPRAGAGTVRAQPPGRLERAYPGYRGELGDHGAGRAAAGRGPGGVLQ